LFAAKDSHYIIDPVQGKIFFIGKQLGERAPSGQTEAVEVSARALNRTLHLCEIWETRNTRGSV
jgi:hypothetical protein